MSGNIRQLSTKVNYEECSPPSNIGNIKVRITRPLDLHIMILLISSYNLYDVHCFNLTCATMETLNICMLLSYTKNLKLNA